VAEDAVIEECKTSWLSTVPGHSCGWFKICWHLWSKPFSPNLLYLINSHIQMVTFKYQSHSFTSKYSGPQPTTWCDPGTSYWHTAASGGYSGIWVGFQQVVLHHNKCGISVIWSQLG
jgi:hypothetical protein